MAASSPDRVIIIPTLNAERPLARLLKQLDGETVVVADGGSEDGTLRTALKAGSILALGAPGRGQQMARGAAHALAQYPDARWLLFLHADTELPEDWQEALDTHARDHPGKAAFFAFGGDASWITRLILKAMVRLREIFWALPYGDQGLFVPADLYREVGGFHDMALFEDVDMVVRLRRHAGRLRRLPAEVKTDISLYDRDGVLKRGWRNLRLLSAYRHGVGIDELLRRYRAMK